MPKRVIFGPWIGELGWELTSWQGWVRKVSRNQFSDYEKIVVSFPGRECFYQDISATYVSHPKWFCDIDYSARAFGTDFWTSDGPYIKGSDYIGQPMKPKVDELVAYFQNQLGANIDEFVLPWKKSVYDGQVVGGLYSDTYIPPLIPYSSQDLVTLKPTKNHVSLLHSIMSSQGFDKDRKLVSFYPRSRVKNSDKNWPERYYIKLARFVNQSYPDLVVAFVGSPTGALFSSGVPDGVLDLINVPQDNMLNIHVASMSQSVVGVGPASGILHTAAFAKLPFVTDLDAKQYKKLQKRFSVLHNPFGCNMILLKSISSLEDLRMSIKRLIDDPHSTKS